MSLGGCNLHLQSEFPVLIVLYGCETLSFLWFGLFSVNSRLYLITIKGESNFTSKNLTNPLFSTLYIILQHLYTYEYSNAINRVIFNIA